MILLLASPHDFKIPGNSQGVVAPLPTIIEEVVRAEMQASGLDYDLVLTLLLKVCVSEVIEFAKFRGHLLPFRCPDCHCKAYHLLTVPEEDRVCHCGGTMQRSNK